MTTAEAPCALSTEDMLMVMEMAGWSYIEEDENYYARIVHWGKPSIYARPATDSIPRSADVNIRACFDTFLAIQGQE